MRQLFCCIKIEKAIYYRRMLVWFILDGGFWGQPESTLQNVSRFFQSYIQIASDPNHFFIFLIKCTHIFLESTSCTTWDLWMNTI